MSDVSGNDHVTNNDVSSSENGGFTPNVESQEEYVPEAFSTMEMPDYYSSNLENIETTLQFQTAVIIGFLLLVGFICGWKK